MLVTNHVLAGAVIGRVLGRHPVAAFAAGVASHFAMDSCPHWAPREPGTGGPDAAFTEDFVRVARCDGCAGLTAMAVAAGLSPGRSRLAVVAGMSGAAFPDLDKPIKYFFGSDPFPSRWRRFHKRVQNEAPHRAPLEVAYGMLLAAAFVRLLHRRG